MTIQASEGMRSSSPLINGLFTVAYWVLSIVFVASAAIASLFPGKTAVHRVVATYAMAMRRILRYITGITIEYRGLENKSVAIYAAKHQSWFDGFSIYGVLRAPTFVTGDHSPIHFWEWSYRSSGLSL